VFTTAPKTTTITSARASPPTIPSADVVSLRPSTERMIVLENSPLRAKTSPWAKLINCRIP